MASSAASTGHGGGHGRGAAEDDDLTADRRGAATDALSVASGGEGSVQAARPARNADDGATPVAVYQRRGATARRRRRAVGAGRNHEDRAHAEPTSGRLTDELAQTDGMYGRRRTDETAGRGEEREKGQEQSKRATPWESERAREEVGARGTRLACGERRSARAPAVNTTSTGHLYLCHSLGLPPSLYL